MRKNKPIMGKKNRYERHIWNIRATRHQLCREFGKVDGLRAFNLMLQALLTSQ